MHRDRDSVEHLNLDGAIVQVSDGDRVAALLDIGGGEGPGFAALVVKHDAFHLHPLIGAEAEIVGLPRRQLRQLPVADEDVVAEQRGLAAEQRRGVRGQDQVGIKIGGVIDARRRLHRQCRLYRLRDGLDALGLARRSDHRAAGNIVDGLEAGNARHRRRLGGNAAFLRCGLVFFQFVVLQFLRLLLRFVCRLPVRHRRAGLQPRAGGEIDCERIEIRRGRGGAGTGGGQGEHDAVPILAGGLENAGLARERQGWRGALVACRQAGVVERCPGCGWRLITQGKRSLERLGGADIDAHLRPLLAVIAARHRKLPLQVH